MARPYSSANNLHRFHLLWTQIMKQVPSYFRNKFAANNPITVRTASTHFVWLIDILFKTASGPMLSLDGTQSRTKKLHKLMSSLNATGAYVRLPIQAGTWSQQWYHLNFFKENCLLTPHRREVVWTCDQKWWKMVWAALSRKQFSRPRVWVSFDLHNVVDSKMVHG